MDNEQYELIAPSQLKITTMAPVEDILDLDLLEEEKAKIESEKVDLRRQMQQKDIDLSGVQAKIDLARSKGARTSSETETSPPSPPVLAGGSSDIPV